MGCDGEPNSGRAVDACEVCGGNNLCKFQVVNVEIGETIASRRSQGQTNLQLEAVESRPGTWAESAWVAVGVQEELHNETALDGALLQQQQDDFAPVEIGSAASSGHHEEVSIGRRLLYAETDTGGVAQWDFQLFLSDALTAGVVVFVAGLLLTLVIFFFDSKQRGLFSA